MNKSTFYFVIIISVFSVNFLKAQNMFYWNKENKLSYSNFKKTPIQKKTPQGFLDSRLEWKIAEIDGEVPELFVYNKVNEDNSWISMRHDGILKEMQLQFDLSELYARKIRKEFETLRSKKVMKKEAYKERFTAVHRNLEKRLKSISGVSLNQPDLYKILNRQISDSLALYKNY